MCQIATIGRVLENPSMTRKVREDWLNGKCVVVVVGKEPHVSQEEKEDEGWLSSYDFMSEASYKAVYRDKVYRPVSNEDLYDAIRNLPLPHYSSEYKDEDIKVVSEDIKNSFSLQEYLDADPALKYLLDALCFGMGLGLEVKKGKIQVVKVRS